VLVGRRRSRPLIYPCKQIVLHPPFLHPRKSARIGIILKQPSAEKSGKPVASWRGLTCIALRSPLAGPEIGTDLDSGGHLLLYFGHTSKVDISIAAQRCRILAQHGQYLDCQFHGPLREYCIVQFLWLVGLQIVPLTRRFLAVARGQESHRRSLMHLDVVRMKVAAARSKGKHNLRLDMPYQLDDLVRHLFQRGLIQA